MNRKGEHPSSCVLSSEELDRLVAEYKSNGNDFLKSLDIKWDLDSEFTLFHDLSLDTKSDDLEVVTFSQSTMLHALHNFDSYHINNFWNCMNPQKTASVIHSVIEGIAITPPFLEPEEIDSRLFVVSGHNRFGLAMVSCDDTFPLLIPKKLRRVFDQIVASPG